MTPLDARLCYQALAARDARFDGRVFVGVTSTGIYCRPVCPARTAKREHCRFFTSAAAAQAAGFRPCLRCRPESAPGHGAWDGTSNTVARGVELIALGALDGEDASVEVLAERLGVGARHLRRLFAEHLGASPVAVAQTRRVAFAKQLLHETRLPMSEVAHAAGFGSVRRFNETFRELFDRSPNALRRKAMASLPEGSASTAGVTLQLRYRPPYDFSELLAFFRARAIPGVELVTDNRYLRTFDESGAVGSVEVGHDPARHALRVHVRTNDVRVLSRVVNRVRRAFDVASDVALIGDCLAADPLLAALVHRRPGLRVPGGWSGFELAVRALLGQQVSVAAARRLCERLTLLCGSRVSLGTSLVRLFPSAEQVARADLGQLGAPRARLSALAALAEAALTDPHLFEPRGNLEATIARLRAVRGVGPWTAHYIALRAARDPDAFPVGDRGILRAVSLCTGARCTPEMLERRAERWRPWRAYAAQHLLAADAASSLSVVTTCTPKDTRDARH
ncbi:MAG TPA: AlkA N-terminal domain-containing protein [Polyangiaceae bacterium]|nr:AlkA N-terminal domain-containing protein [Polyangiaceae bacterium]